MNKITVICPLYNKAKYIESTINSVRNQLYQNWELLIIDDGSNDGSYELVQKIILESKSENIFLIKRSDFKQSKGASVCRNIGIQLAKGDFVLFLDADDLLVRQCLSQRIECVKKYPNFSYYIFNVAYFKTNIENVYAKEKPGFIEIVNFFLACNKHKFCLGCFLKFNLLWHTSGPLWRREALESLNGFDESFQRLQDPELHTRALLNEGLSFKYLKIKTKYDVLHRMDEDRGVWNKNEFIEKQVKSTIKYIDLFSSKLIEQGKKKYLKKMQGFLLWGEIVAYRLLLTKEEPTLIDSMRSSLKQIYNLKVVEKIVTRKYKIFIFFFRRSLKSSFCIKIKVPGILAVLYKQII